MVKDIVDFQKEVMESKLPVIVDFWAEWCGPCKTLSPVFEKVAGEYTGKLVFAKVNVDEHVELAQNAGVLNIPCIVFFKQGEEIGRVVGFSSESALRGKIDGWLTG